MKDVKHLSVCSSSPDFADCVEVSVFRKEAQESHESPKEVEQLKKAPRLEKTRIKKT